MLLAIWQRSCLLKAKGIKRKAFCGRVGLPSFYFWSVNRPYDIILAYVFQSSALERELALCIYVATQLGNANEITKNITFFA